MRTLITVLDGITETSMPFNEFVLYRANHYLYERQVVIVCNKMKELPQVIIPDTLKIVYAGISVSAVRKAILKEVAICEKEKTGYVIHLHQVKSALLAQIAMIGTGLCKKTLFTVHSTFPGYSFHNKMLSFLNACFAHHITCVSKVAYSYYPKIIRIWKGKRIRTVQNGVDTERMDTILGSIKKYGETVDKKVTFVYVARIVPVKNHEFLVRILAKTDPKSRMIFVGSEDPQGRIRKLAKELGVDDRIQFTGLVPRNEVFKILSAADVYVSSSTLEGLPVSVLEAMYSELPCILSDIPQHKEVAEGAGDSADVLALKQENWVQKINEYVSLSHISRIEKGAKAKMYVKHNFSLTRMHANYEKIYAEADSHFKV